MKSPFIVVQDFLSPLTCEKIISNNIILQPDLDINGKPQKLEHHLPIWQHDIIEKFKELIPEIENRYECNYRGLEQPVLQYFPENAECLASQPGCENSKYLRKKWIKIKDVDLVGYIWLKDYNSNVPLDPNFEVFGGKLEFPVYNFSLLPQRGTMIIFPAGPHFINAISPILLGDLYQIKLNICVQNKDGGLWLYQPQNFPGKWEQWFEGYF